MNEYIYILSNPSMPGLLKVGKTTKTPSKRMAELNTTGVPTPFKLEVSFLVEKSAVSEKAIHKALSDYRIAKNREFFKISVKQAVELALPAISSYKVAYARKAHGVSEIEAHFQRKRAIRAKEMALKEAQKKKELQQNRWRYKNNIQILSNKISRFEKQLSSLGARPVKKKIPFPFNLLWLCYFPVPFGFMFYIGAFQVFNPETKSAGFICLLLIAAGWFESKVDKKNGAEFKAANKKFQIIDEYLCDLRSQLESSKKSLANLE